MRKLKLLTAIFTLLLGTVASWAQGWTASEAGTGDFYLYNVGANAYLENGASWGTHAALKSSGFVVNVTLSDGVYTIGTNSKYSGKFFTDNGYVDTGNSTNWTFEPVEGQPNTYKLKTAGGSYAYATAGMYNVGIGADPGTNKAYWKLVTSDNRNSVTNAAADNPVELTHKINNPRFDDNVNGWSGTVPARGGNTGGTNGNADSYNDRNPCAEHYDKTFDTYQQLTGLANGTYAVSVQGFYREGSTDNAASGHIAGTESLNALLYANDQEQPLMSIIEGAGKASGGKTVTSDGIDGAIPNDMAAASYFFSAGLYWNAVFVTVTDGTLTFGIKKSTSVNADWTIFDNFRLQYFGDCTIAQAKNAALIKAFNEALAAAAALENVAMEADAKTAINNALIQGRAINTETATAEQLTSATTALNDAVLLAESSIPIYAQIKPLVDGLYAQDPSFDGKTKYENGTYKTLSEVYSDYYAYAISNLATTSGTDFTNAIINPGFEFGNTIGWTYESSWDHGAKSTTDNTYKMTNSEGDYLFNIYSLGHPITQTIPGLPNGLYQVDAVVATNGNHKVYLIANNAHEGIQCGDDQGTGIEGHVSVVVMDGTLTIGAVGGSEEDNSYVANGGVWYKVDNFRLTYLGEMVSDEVAEELIAEIPTGKMSDACSAALQTAKTNLENEKSLANYNALVTAIEAANVSIASYALIASGTISTDNATGWAISTSTGSLACNTWSTEGDSDGSNMTTPFIQDWASAGNALGEGALYYEINELNPGEYYKVTALVRAYNEIAGGAVDGANFFVNDGNKSLDEIGVACTGRNGKYGNFSVVGQVDENGKLRFGLQLTSTSAINWVAIKNVTIETATGKVPTAIALSEHSTTMGTGTQQTLTAIITPEDADDKLVIWTSSDETVATVADGVINALKAGSATITARAYAGDNLTATTTITVADAPAPSFYSEIAVGDFYIVNAATGKFLGGANNWGTHASLIEHGIPVTVAVSDGKYTFDTHISNGGDNHYFGGEWMDGGITSLYITSLDNGKYSISTADGSAFVSAHVGNTLVANDAANASSSLAQWYFLSKNDRDKMLAAATAESPVDATYYIKDANFDRNYQLAGWIGEYTRSGDYTNMYAKVENKAADVYQIIENIPNGTYTVRMQALTTGDATFYANAKEVPVQISHTMGPNDFGGGLPRRTLKVNVTDRTLKIGVKSDDTDMVLYFDNAELFMIGYNPVTEITADIEKTVIEVGQTAAISNVAITPADASFTSYTYVSSNEEVATVSAEGVVTGVAFGEATISIKAEMEDVKKDFNVTVTAPAIAPTAIALAIGNEVIDPEEGYTLFINKTATITATVAPAEANQAVTYSSDDPGVVTVDENGVLTPVAYGNANITVTSAAKNDVFAVLPVTIDAPLYTELENLDFAEGPVNSCNIITYNKDKKGTDVAQMQPVTGWTMGVANGDARAAGVMAYGNTDYLLGTNDTSKPYKAPATNPAGETEGNALAVLGVWSGTVQYVQNVKFAAGSYELTIPVYNVGGTTAFTKNLIGFIEDNGTEHLLSSKSYSVGSWTTETLTLTFEDETYGKLSVGYQGANSGGDASQHLFIDAINIRYISPLELAQTALQAVIDAAPEVRTANIGSTAFLYDETDVNTYAAALESAAAAKIAGDATVESVTEAKETLQSAIAAYNALEINEPADGQLFNVILTYDDWTYDQKAVTYLAGDRTDMGGYNIKYSAPANQNLAQAFTFTKVSGNNYKMSQIDADGAVRYISTGVPYSGNTSQIRTTTEADKALVVTVIPTATDGVWNLKNTEANNYIGSQDAGVYTVNSHIDFNIVETTKPSIAINTTAAGWGTTILPFAVASLPEGVKAYTCAGVEGDGKTLTLVEVDALEANKPYIIEGAWEETLTGDAQGAALNYTVGLLTGTYENIDAPDGSYILQKQNDKVGFYHVDYNYLAQEGMDKPKVKANRVYLTAPESASGARAFFFDGGETTGISAIEALANGDAQIFNVNGVQQPRLMKGLNIIVTKDGKTHKVMVK